MGESHEWSEFFKKEREKDKLKELNCVADAFFVSGALGLAYALGIIVAIKNPDTIQIYSLKFVGMLILTSAGSATGFFGKMWTKHRYNELN